MSEYYAIAIDGPAGAGKSTIAKLVSKKLGFVYIDTGAMYRAIGYYCNQNGINPDDEKAIEARLDDICVSITYLDGEQVVMLNNENVNPFIRTPEVGQLASSVSVHKSVREKLVALQRDLSKTENVVMDGRDIASAVLPDAQIKIYLDAQVEVRAKRRYDELIAKGEQCELATIIEEVKERDYRDMHRDNSPLVRVEEAVLIDSSYMSIDEVVDRIMDIYENTVK